MNLLVKLKQVYYVVIKIQTLVFTKPKSMVLFTTIKMNCFIFTDNLASHTLSHQPNLTVETGKVQTNNRVGLKLKIKKSKNKRKIK